MFRNLRISLRELYMLAGCDILVDRFERPCDRQIILQLDRYDLVRQGLEEAT